jgi:transglutaminase-like putative cysteine protease
MAGFRAGAVADHPGLDAPKLIHAGGQTELVEDLANARAPIPPSGAPPRFKYIGRLEVTQFANWSQVSQVMAPLFQRSEVLAADSPLKLEIAKISAASPSPKVRAALALALVQTKVRYEFVGLNDGGYVPATADQTWSRRYGDCKGKTALLLALLHGLGIEGRWSQ